MTLPVALLDGREREPTSDAGLVGLRNLEQLERAAAVAGERLELAERAVGLEDLGAALVGADEEGAEHTAMLRPRPDATGGR